MLQDLQQDTLSLEGFFGTETYFIALLVCFAASLATSILFRQKGRRNAAVIFSGLTIFFAIIILPSATYREITEASKFMRRVAHPAVLIVFLGLAYQFYLSYYFTFPKQNAANSTNA